MATQHRRSIPGWLLCSVLICVTYGCSRDDSADTAPATEPEAVRFDVAIVDGDVDGGDRTLRILQGQQVELAWTVDAPVTVHVHGYDLELKLEPGRPRVQRFVAHATGRFPVTAHGFAKEASAGHAHDHESDHVHDSGQDEAAEPTLVYLEIHPR